MNHLDVVSHYKKAFPPFGEGSDPMHACFDGETGKDQLDKFLFCLKAMWPISGMEKGRVRITYMYDPDCPESIAYFEALDNNFTGNAAVRLTDPSAVQS